MTIVVAAFVAAFVGIAVADYLLLLLLPSWHIVVGSQWRRHWQRRRLLDYFARSCWNSYIQCCYRRY